MKMKLCLGLIHNYDAERYNWIRPELDKLKDALSGSWDVEIFEIAKQPKIVRHSIPMAIFSMCLYWKINREWMRYRLLKPRNIFFDTAALIRHLVLTYIYRNTEIERSVIYAFISDKHIRAWNELLEREGDFLICFEDDAVFTAESISSLQRLLNPLRQERNKPIYLDFAGGCSPEELKIDKLETRSDKFRKFYRKPVTNTVCSYLISQKTAKIFLQNLLRYPWLRLLAGDWLINKLFIMTASRNKYYCYHTHPHIFRHGSTTGFFKSLI